MTNFVRSLNADIRSGYDSWRVIVSFSAVAALVAVLNVMIS